MTNQSQKPRTQRTPMFADGERVKVKCIDHVLGAAKSKTEQIGITLQVVDGPHAGTTLSYYGFFTEKTEEETIKAMKALGWNGTDAPGCQSMYGKEALATIQHEEEQDEKTREVSLRMRVRWINQIGVRMDNAYDGAALQRFGQRLNAIGRRMGGSSAGAAGSGPQRLGGQDADERDRDRRTGGRDDAPPPPQDDDAPPFERGGRGQRDARWR